MTLSQKCQYAVRAVLELSKRYDQGPVSVGEIAAAQAVPQRFLEVILNDLKRSGLIASRRGARGGYYLADPPDRITVGRVIRLVEGPLHPVRCTEDAGADCCPLKEHCSLIDLWNRAKEAVEAVYEAETFQSLADRERELQRTSPIDYSI